MNADVDGIIRRFSGGEVTDSRTSLPKSFVPEGHLIGRAFAVFWPIHSWRIYRGPTRVKIIR
ncbi:MAG: hypothetical protein HC813_00430 [Planctomycetes bacterium]|nr:hypothetical protein [Planctomycetota bacterium]